MSTLEVFASLVTDSVIGAILYFILAGPADVPDGIALGFVILFVTFANGFADLSIRLRKRGI